VLDELRAVRWPFALALFAVGALGMALLLTLVFGVDSKTGVRIRSVPAASAANVRVGANDPVAAATATTTKTAASTGTPAVATVSLPALVGQRFMVGLHTAAPTPALLADVRKGEIGGIVVFTEQSSPADVKRAAGRLQAAAAAGHRPALLIATDQEGGTVKRLPGPPDKPLSELAPSAAQREGARTGSYLRGFGINVDLAPVVDLGLPQSFITRQERTISPNPARVAAVAAGFVAGLQSTQVMPVAKHFPGLGAAVVNTDEAKSVVGVPPGRALIPYERLIAADLPAVMLSTAFYPSIDSANAAAWSPRIVEGLLRRRLGFDGLTITDALGSPGVEQSISAPEAAVAAAGAGADVLLIDDPEAFRDAYDALLEAAESGQVSRRQLIASYRRILTAKQEFGN
jgi:beta-N-acetylhexosaminidase